MTTPKTLLRITTRVALVLGGWTAIMLAMPFVGPARQVAVVGDRTRALRAIAAAGGTVVEVRDGATLARSDKPGFVAALYRNGARLVIEGRIGAGCFSSSTRAR
ncbi:MAG: hypothetical protein WC729_10195 [Sphingomonas sp.]|uniref:hypothetical protein n=1 Tax=Sphingomonas sp. TaxID=28214 RepID=UPI003566C151